MECDYMAMEQDGSAIVGLLPRKMTEELILSKLAGRVSCGKTCFTGTCDDSSCTCSYDFLPPLCVRGAESHSLPA
uniref:Uncharacterized protein n=1 Tax=Setaria italica TaxID=4555 RepID=K3YMF5_SETIT